MLKVTDALVRLAEPRKSILEAIQVVKHKSNLETVRACAAQKRSSVLADPPPILFHESRRGEGNYLYGKIVYPVPDSAFRNSAYVLPVGACIFAHGTVKLTSTEKRPAVVLLTGRNSETLRLTMYVPDAPLASMEAELFQREKVSAFEREIFGDLAESKVKQRWDVARHIRDCGMWTVKDTLFDSCMWIKRDGVLPFLRLSQPADVEEAKAVAKLLRVLEKAGLQKWCKTSGVDEEWMEQARLQHGFEFSSVFTQESLPFSVEDDDPLNACHCHGSIARLASLMLRGALDLAMFDPEKSRVGNDDLIPDRAFQTAMTTLAKEEDAILPADETPLVPPPPDASVSKILSDTRTLVSAKTLKVSEDQKDWVQGFVAEYMPAARKARASGHFWMDVVELTKLFNDRFAVLVLLKDRDDGLLSHVRLASKGFTCDITNMDSIVRLLHFPWVWPVFVEGSTTTTIYLNGFERERMTMSPNATALPAEVGDALGEVPDLVKELKHAIGAAQQAAASAASAAPTGPAAPAGSAMAETMEALQSLKRSLVAHQQKAEKRVRV